MPELATASLAAPERAAAFGGRAMPTPVLFNVGEPQSQPAGLPTGEQLPACLRSAL